MSISKILSIICLSMFLTSSAYAQTTPAAAPAQGGPAAGGPAAGGAAPAGGGDMPQTKTFKIDAFFNGIDTNKDGFLTLEEFKAVGLTDRMFKTPPFCDPDGDKKISKKEMTECKLPEALDMNKDGALTPEEIIAYEKTKLGKTRGPGEPTPE